MTKEEEIAVNDTIEIIIANSSKCKNCVLCHDNKWCFFGYQCLTNDFCHYTENSAVETILKKIKEK